ncbi:MAG: VOC family protein [Solirubrobacteraceae bacterium]|jgi:catechol 2,3-dioxygenase-like lactoylglutathione lyase family enzyme
MFGEFDHVGFLVRDLDAAVAEAQRAFSLPLVRTLELPQYGIAAAFLGPGRGTLEIFTIEDPELREPRLDGAQQRIDHMAFRVEELDGPAATLRAAGSRFSGPDRRGEVPGPLELGGMRHIWTLPESTAGLALQLIEVPAR